MKKHLWAVQFPCGTGGMLNEILHHELIQGYDRAAVLQAGLCAAQQGTAVSEAHTCGQEPQADSAKAQRQWAAAQYSVQSQLPPQLQVTPLQATYTNRHIAQGVLLVRWWEAVRLRRCWSCSCMQLAWLQQCLHNMP